MTLRHHLDQSARFDAEYGGNLASHLPMTLTALSRLGADDARLAAFATAYARRLHPAPPAEPWPEGEPWQRHLGNPRAWPAYRSLFNDWLDHEGAPSLLPQVLPTLLRGVGAAAFHGQIRTAYALAAGHSHALADALAYWACRWFELDARRVAPVGRGAAVSDPARVLASSTLAPPSSALTLIAERMVAVAAQPGFAEHVARLHIDADDTLQRLATLAASLYTDSRDFTVLHLVTSAHALRVLLPWVEPDEAAQAVAHYWHNFAAGHAARGLTAAFADSTRSVSLPWTKIVDLAIGSDDDHVIKLVDSCREQARAYGGEVWCLAALRAVVRPDAALTVGAR